MLERVRPSRAPAVVSDAIFAMNVDDSAGVLDCFAAQGLVDAFGMLFHGHDEIRLWCDGWIIARRIRFADVIHLIDGDTVSVRAQVTGSGFTGAVTMDFRLHDGVIAELRFTR